MTKSGMSVLDWAVVAERTMDQSAGIEVDPQNQWLKKLPSVRLKGLTANVDRPGG